jgi:hypothetical protein
MISKVILKTMAMAVPIIMLMMQMAIYQARSCGLVLVILLVNLFGSSTIPQVLIILILG